MLLDNTFQMHFLHAIVQAQRCCQSVVNVLLSGRITFYFLTGTTCRTLQNTYHYSGSMANGSKAVHNAEIRGGSRVQQPAVTQGNTEGGNAVITDAPATRLRVHKGISMANSKLETSHVILTALIYYTRGGREDGYEWLEDVSW